MLRPEEWRLVLLAAGVRCAVLLLTTSVDVALPDYDTSKFITPETARVTAPTHFNAGSRESNPPFPRSPLHGWLVWDSVFFADISARGYVFEQYYAFFPLLPALTAWVSPRLFAALALAINAAASVASTVLLYRLGERVTADRRLSALACLFFVLNPATIFHAAAYSEAAFTTTTLSALYWLLCRDQVAPAVAAVALSCGLRSNGVVSAGYLGHHCLRRAVAAWRTSKVRAAGTALLGVAAVAAAVGPLLAFQYSAFQTFCPTSGPHPFNFPHHHEQQDQLQRRPVPESLPNGSGSSRSSSGPDSRWPRPWCSSRLPYVYGFVQSEYWNVGFMRYWTLQQLPNFLLAAPVLLLSFAGLMEYGRANGRHLLLRLGLTPLPSADPPSATTAESPQQDEPGAEREQQRAGAPSGELASSLAPDGIGVRHRHRTGVPCRVGATRPTRGSRSEDCRGTRGLTDSAGSGYLSPDLAVFMYPWAFSLAVAVTSMHVQVATRFLLSSCPPLYWYMAHLALGGRTAGGSEDSEEGRIGTLPGRACGGEGCDGGSSGPRAKQTDGGDGGWCAVVIWRWCLSYMALGCVLFVNFYPWT